MENLNICQPIFSLGDHARFILNENHMHEYFIMLKINHLELKVPFCDQY